MSTRMQQRRGTVATWTAANPILAPGEIGFEIDTNKFKIGDGVNRWENLTYFTADAAAALADLIDGAPGLLDTLNELAAAIGDDENFFSTVESNIATAKQEAIDSAVGTAAGDATTKANNAKSGAETTAAGYVSTHNSDTTNVHGIANTADLATQSYADDSSATALQDAKDYSDSLASDYEAAGSIATHSADTTNVHGIANTADLATQQHVATQVGLLLSSLTKSSVGLSNVDNTSDANKPVSTATQAELDLKAPLDDSALTGVTTAETLEVSGDLTVDGDFTVSGTTTTVSTQNLSVSDPMIYMGDGNTTNSVDLGIVSAFNDGTYQHTGLVRDSSDGKWKLFKGVTDEPTTTVNFSQGSLDTLAVGLVEGVAHLSGTSTAPTASLGTNTTQIATTAFVHASVADLVNLDLVLDGGGVA